LLLILLTYSRAMVLTAHSALSRRPGFFASVARRHVYALIPASGESGPHALAVRDHAARHATRPRPSHSTPTFVTVATPLIPRDVEKTCKDSLAADQAGGVVLAQPLENCLRDENNAKQQLDPVWLTYPAPLRERCEKEATLLGEGSYVDLLTCIQMSDPAKITPAIDLKGARKTRNKN
jgi:hypothetical protein